MTSDSESSSVTADSTNRRSAFFDSLACWRVRLMSSKTNTNARPAMCPAVIELNEIRRSGAGRACRGGRGGRRQLHRLELGHLLRPSVLLDHEVLPGQARHGIPVLAEHDDVDGDEIDAGAEARRGLLGGNECAEEGEDDKAYAGDDKTYGGDDKTYVGPSFSSAGTGEGPTERLWP